MSVESINLPGECFTVVPPEPDFTFRFTLHGKEIGRFDFGASPPTFTGDVDASARMFVDAVLRMMPNLPKGETAGEPA